MKQKYHHGDLVKIPEHRPDYGDCVAIVIGSYRDQYGGDDGDTPTYTLYVHEHGEVSWFDEATLVLIERGRSDLLAEWRAAAEALAKQRGDLDWIFSRGPEIVERGYGSSIAALAKCFGLNDLWPSGEGWEWYENARLTMDLAKPFLRSGDKAGWLDFCAKLKAEMARGGAA